MEITPSIPGDRQVIAGYGPGLFRISGTVYTGSVLVFPDRTVSWPVTALEGATPESLAAVCEAEPAVEVLLLGVGERNRPLPAGLRNALREAGVVVDGMDTGAACRTYNVLMAEDRRVAAALVALS
jgi:uncharacterized protein